MEFVALKALWQPSRPTDAPVSEPVSSRHLGRLRDHRVRGFAASGRTRFGGCEVCFHSRSVARIEKEAQAGEEGQYRESERERGREG